MFHPTENLDLTLLSFLNETNEEKIAFFFKICTSIKNFFSFEDFKLLLFSYLYNNLYYITYIVYKSVEPKTQLFYSLEGILYDVYSDVNIVNYRDLVLKRFQIDKFGAGKEYQKEYFVTHEDFQEIFKDQKHLFNIKNLENY